MSIRALSAVINKYPKGGSEKLVLITLADWCDDNGGSLYPSIKAVAKKACVEPRQAQRIMHALIEAGILAVVGNENGGAPGVTRKYKLNINKIEDMPRLHDTQTGDIQDTGVIGDTGVMQDADGCHLGHRGVSSKTETGVMGDTLSVSDPLVNHQLTVIEGARKKPRTRKPKLSDRPDSWKPSEAHIAKALENMLSIDDELAAFTNHHDAKGSQFADWNAAFSYWLGNAIKFAKSRPNQQNKLPQTREEADAAGDAQLARILAKRNGNIIEGEVIHG